MNCVFCGQQKLTGWCCMILFCKAIYSSKSNVFPYLLWNCYENRVIIVKLTVLTVRMALQSLKAAWFSIEVENINILWHKMNCWDVNINFRKKKIKKKMNACIVEFLEFLQGRRAIWYFGSFWCIEEYGLQVTWTKSCRHPVCRNMNLF